MNKVDGSFEVGNLTPASAPKVAHVDRGLFSLCRCMQASHINIRGVADIILYYSVLYSKSMVLLTILGYPERCHNH